MKGIREFKEGYEPKLTVVTINKKTHTKFFLKNSTQSYGPARGGGRGGGRGEAGNLMNPKSGTVIDSDITSPDKYEFLLMPQNVTQGTGAPSHFQVIFDSSSIKEDDLQRLTNGLCYGYFNWTGAIRTPCSCKNAFSAAKLMAKYTKESAPAELRNNLHFL